MEQTVKKKFGIRDIMTIAAMMVITYLVAMVIGSVTRRQAAERMRKRRALVT